MSFSPVADFYSDPSMTAYGLQILGQILQDSPQQNTDPKLRNKNSAVDAKPNWDLVKTQRNKKFNYKWTIEAWIPTCSWQRLSRFIQVKF